MKLNRFEVLQAANVSSERRSGNECFVLLQRRQIALDAVAWLGSEVEDWMPNRKLAVEVAHDSD